MEIQSLTLGQALATLATEGQANNDNDTSLAENGAQQATDENHYLRALRKRLQTLRSADYTAALWQALPERCCEATTPFLAGNEDFFLLGILLNSPIYNHEGHDARLFKHLNDCYWCFEEFCLVMRDFYNKSQELLQTKFN